MDKKELRKKYRQLREGLPLNQVNEKSLAIANNLLQLDIWDKSFYHIFLSIRDFREVNTDYILNILAGKDKHIVISKSDFSNQSMSHFLLSDDTKLNTNNYGIPEPENGIPIDVKMLDVVFVPLLAFDKAGNRIGYGKGFYDRFLSNCRSDTIKIGLSFFSADSNGFDVSKTDIPLDFCVTPETVYSF